jgi:hypothetical protein
MVVKYVLKKKVESRIQVAKTSFLRSVKVCTRLDRMRNYEIRKDLDVFAINDKTESDLEFAWRD